MITKDEFIAYEKIRKKGVTNMFAITTVSELSGLSREKVIEIMKTYVDLMDLHPDVRQ